MAALELDRVSVAYGAERAVSELSLRVNDGELLVLLGPSGCGKSTLLHAIAGLTPLAGGRVLIGGRDVTQCEPAERNVGMVFQSYALYPSMSVERNLSFGLRVRGLPRAEIAARVRRAAGMLRLEALLQRRPAQLSGGQRQRVAIGRALVRDAELFLLDEPLSNLDARLRAELRRELKLLHSTLGATMIYVTHDQIEAMTLGTRIAVLRHGAIEQLGAPDDVYARPASRYVAEFLGAPPAGLLRGRLRLMGPAPRFESERLSVDLPDYVFQPARVDETTPSNDAAALAADGAPVDLALPPEILSEAPGGPLRGTLTLIESQGNRSVLWIDCAGQPIAALAGPAPSLRVGASLCFAIDTARVSLFDAANGLRL